MNKPSSTYLPERLAPFVLSLIAGLAILSGWLTQVSAEVENQSLQVSKRVLTTDDIPGGMIEYGIVLSNTGLTSVTVNLTDTFPVSTTFVAESLERSCDFDVYWGDAGMVSRKSLLQPGQVVTATYQVVVDQDIPADQLTLSSLVSEITGTVMVEDILSGRVISDVTATQVMTGAEIIFLPSMYSLDGISETNGFVAHDGGQAIEHDAVRTEVFAAEETALDRPVSAWNFEETFSPPCDHENWRIVRQDTDDVINKVSAHDGYLDLRMESRFDYMIVSNLTELPPLPYRVTARMRLEDASPSLTGGIILGGDYDGTSECPKFIDENFAENSDYSTCFNEYYRFMFIAGNESNQFITQIKRIDEHSETNNTGSGTELASGQLTVLKENSDWITWNVDVHEDGTIRWYADGDLVHEVTDTAFLENNYFGFWSSTSEMSFSNTQIDWVTVEPIE